MTARGPFLKGSLSASNSCTFTNRNKLASDNTCRDNIYMTMWFI